MWTECSPQNSSFHFCQQPHHQWALWAHPITQPPPFCLWLSVLTAGPHAAVIRQARPSSTVPVTNWCHTLQPCWCPCSTFLQSHLTQQLFSSRYTSVTASQGVRGVPAVERNVTSTSICPIHTAQQAEWRHYGDWMNWLCDWCCSLSLMLLLEVNMSWKILLPFTNYLDLMSDVLKWDLLYKSDSEDVTLMVCYFYTDLIWGGKKDPFHI